MRTHENFEALRGKTIKRFTNATVGSEDVGIECDDGTAYRLKYYPDCCASCSLNEIVGDISDLIDTPILMAEVVVGGADVHPAPEHADSFTWAFYKLATVKGYVTLRFLGESNGYYSETVDFERVHEDAP
jgi:hypothetical protein